MRRYAINHVNKKESSNDLLSHAVSHAVPSALKGLTSVVGMVTGDPLRSYHWTLHCLYPAARRSSPHHSPISQSSHIHPPPHAQHRSQGTLGRLVFVCSIRYRTSTANLSTWSSPRNLRGVSPHPGDLI